jgi:hypothetical protein
MPAASCHLPHIASPSSRTSSGPMPRSRSTFWRASSVSISTQRCHRVRRRCQVSRLSQKTATSCSAPIFPSRPQTSLRTSPPNWTPMKVLQPTSKRRLATATRGPCFRVSPPRLTWRTSARQNSDPGENGWYQPPRSPGFHDLFRDEATFRVASTIFPRG